jgi:hypothetical protein
VSDGTNYLVLGLLTELTPSSNQVLSFNGTSWVPTNLSSIGTANAQYILSLPVNQPSGTPVYQGYIQTEAYNITSISITSNVATFTCANDLTSGTQVLITGLGNATFLNGQVLTVISTGLSLTQFEANFTHANYGPTAETQGQAQDLKFSPYAIDGIYREGINDGTPLVIDTAYNVIREDFVSAFGSAINPSLTMLGSTGWILVGSANSNTTCAGYPPYLGQVGWDSGSTNQFEVLFTNVASAGSTAGLAQVGMALLEHPGWRATWIFKVGPTFFRGGAAPNFTTTHKSLYVGFAGSSTYLQLSPGTTTPRPDVFLGLRYDTSVSPGTLTLSAAGTASGGNTLYTGTITGGANGAFIGMSFTITGFTTSANNGTFTCVNSSGTTLTLNNSSGAAESHAGSAAGPAGIGDSTYMFEVVENLTFSTNARHNKQGTTYNTTLSPTVDQWMRLDMTCVTAGQVVMTLTTDGGTSATHTFTVGTMSLTSGAGVGGGFTNGVSYVDMTISSAAGSGVVGTNPGVQGTCPFVAGSSVTISGATGGISSLNGTWTLSNSDVQAPYLIYNIGSGTASGAGQFTAVGYPALFPIFAFGNDDGTSATTDQMRITCDFFGLAWNPALRTSGGIPDPTKPRYW